MFGLIAVSESLCFHPHRPRAAGEASPAWGGQGMEAELPDSRAIEDGTNARRSPRRCATARWEETDAPVDTSANRDYPPQPAEERRLSRRFRRRAPDDRESRRYRNAGDLPAGRPDRPRARGGAEQQVPQRGGDEPWWRRQLQSG